MLQVVHGSNMVSMADGIPIAPATIYVHRDTHGQLRTNMPELHQWGPTYSFDNYVLQLSCGLIGATNIRTTSVYEFARPAGLSVTDIKSAVMVGKKLYLATRRGIILCGPSSTKLIAETRAEAMFKASHMAFAVTIAGDIYRITQRGLIYACPFDENFADEWLTAMHFPDASYRLQQGRLAYQYNESDPDTVQTRANLAAEIRNRIRMQTLIWYRSGVPLEVVSAMGRGKN
jgi:hypothetical protein